MDSGTSLQVLDAAHQRLATVTTVDEAKELRDHAAAVRKLAKDSKQGLKEQNKWALFKFRCERKAGELLL